MRNARRSGSRLHGFQAFLAAVCVWAAACASAKATTLEELVGAVVRIKTFINPDGRSVANLGRERSGSGIVIDQSGLVLTIGYLMVEAHTAEVATNDGRNLPASIVGYDHETGFGLLRTVEPLKLKPIAIGKAEGVKAQDPALVVSSGGAGMVLPVHVASRREFAGTWEYLLDSAIYTVPPHPAWSGAALIDRDGKLIGVGSLIVNNAQDDTTLSPGNMFVPIDGLIPIMGDLLANGRVTGPAKPWIGVSAQVQDGRLLVARVTPQGPAEKAGLRRGDAIAAVNGAAPRTLGDFYRKLWALGAAGVTVPLDVERDGARQRIEVPSVNRLDHLKLKSTF